MITASTILSTDLSQKQLIEVGYDLQRQLRAKEAAASKEKAVLMQKIELLEMEIREGKEREVSMKKMYDTMIRALKPSSNNVPREIDLINEMHSKQLAEAKQRQAELAASFEAKINELRASLAQSENERKNGERQREEMGRVYRVRLEEMELKCKKVGECVNDEREEFDVLSDKAKVGELNELLDKVRSEHSEELARLKEQYDSSLDEMKQMYEQEKSNMEAKLKKANTVIRSLQDTKMVQEDYLEDNTGGRKGEELSINERLEDTKLESEFYLMQGDEDQRFNLPSIYASNHRTHFRFECKCHSKQCVTLSLHGSCKKISATATQIECKCCKANLLSEDLIHILSELSHNNLRTAQSNEKELLRKLWIAEKSLREITGKYVTLKGKYERSRAELKEFRKGQEGAEACLKNEIKFLITKLSKTKMKLAQNVEKTADSINVLQLPSNLAKSQAECFTNIGGDYAADEYKDYRRREKPGTCRLKDSSISNLSEYRKEHV
eukprot:TRINITY_DN7882_c0_g1_i17.p1 TRINITY_DN7882_c0_g1~~TRINITY_DN7882_c0_g1_i17.p1  ORF type:complete len:497 (-),score=110.82 TRINITY_DN7882_c0_g1_i17:147-1637(-)